MSETQSIDVRVIEAAMLLAGEKPWSDVSLREIAEAAGSNLAEVSGSFSSKSDVLAAFIRHIDKQVLANAPSPQQGESQRDALFEVLMSRFDVLMPYKNSLRSIAGSGDFEISLIKPMLATQGWMLQAAGIDSDGPSGALRTVGLASVYASVFRTWLEDDDPGLARTMAVLDRRLRRGETAMSGLNSVLGAARRVKRMLRSGFSRSRTRGGDGQTYPSGGAPGEGAERAGPSAAT